MKITSTRDLTNIKKAVPFDLGFQETIRGYEARIATCENLLRVADIIIRDLVEALTATRREFLNAQALNYMHEKNEGSSKTRKTNYSAISADGDKTLKDLVTKYSDLTILNPVQGSRPLFPGLPAVKASSALRKWIAMEDEGIHPHIVEQS